MSNDNKSAYNSSIYDIPSTSVRVGGLSGNGKRVIAA